MIEVIDFKTADQLILGCAELYCKIWKEPPWNEDFWKTNEVINDIRCQLAKFGAKAFLAVADNKVLGFTWGYIVSEREMQDIAGHDKLSDLFSAGNDIFYIDELGVDKEFRRRGIGKWLTNKLLSTVNNGARLVVLRTDKKAESARMLYKKSGFKDLGIEDERYPERTYWILSM